MLLNRKMEVALENLYKQGKVVGGVYFGLGQEACSCASAYALDKDDWFAPMIRNQGSLLVRGFRASRHHDAVHGQSRFAHARPRRHLAFRRHRKAQHGFAHLHAGRSHSSALRRRARRAPAGTQLAVMTYIGDGGQSTGVTYEGINFAAVQNLGLVLIVESNLWAYSTPSEMQYRCKDLAERAIGYGIPGVIVDGTDACQVYDAAHEAVDRAHRGEGPTLIEAKMMRMKGHAIHDAAAYVPKPMFDFWKKRDPIARFENYLVKEKKWLTAKENAELISEVDRVIEAEREIAVNSPMPTPESAEGGVFCEDGCHEIKPKYGMPKVKKGTGGFKQTEAAVHSDESDKKAAVELTELTRSKQTRRRNVVRMLLVRSTSRARSAGKSMSECANLFCRQIDRELLLFSGEGTGRTRDEHDRQYVYDVMQSASRRALLHRHDKSTCTSAVFGSIAKHARVRGIHRCHDR